MGVVQQGLLARTRKTLLSFFRELPCTFFVHRFYDLMSGRRRISFHVLHSMTWSGFLETLSKNICYISFYCFCTIAFDILRTECILDLCFDTRLIDMYCLQCDAKKKIKKNKGVWRWWAYSQLIADCVSQNTNHKSLSQPYMTMQSLLPLGVVIPSWKVIAGLTIHCVKQDNKHGSCLQHILSQSFHGNKKQKAISVGLFCGLYTETKMATQTRWGRDLLFDLQKHWLNISREHW